MGCVNGCAKWCISKSSICPSREPSASQKISQSRFWNTPVHTHLGTPVQTSNKTYEFTTNQQQQLPANLALVRSTSASNISTRQPTNPPPCHNPPPHHLPKTASNHTTTLQIMRWWGGGWWWVFGQISSFSKKNKFFFPRFSLWTHHTHHPTTLYIE